MGGIPKNVNVRKQMTPENDLDRRVREMEQALVMIKRELEQTVVKEEYLRKQLITKFKTAIEQEKKKYAQLVRQYARLKEQYRYVVKQLPKN